jgi:hypothetical protein
MERMKAMTSLVAAAAVSETENAESEKIERGSALFSYI